MVGAIRTLASISVVLAFLATSTVNAETARVEDALDPLGIAPEDTAVAYCRGLSPLTPRCDTWFYAYSSILIQTGSFFTGQLECRINSPNYGHRVYTMQVVSGLTVAYTVTGPGLYAGFIHVHCEAKGLYGAGGSLGGVGPFEVKFTYS